MKLTINQFNARYPNDDACLDALKQVRYGDDYRCPKCDKGKWYRVKGRPAYACACGHQIRPLSGSPFEKSTTSLKTWLYVMFELTNAKNGISALEVERKTEVSYPTALRMLRQLRRFMGDSAVLVGDVEVDETFFKPKSYRDSRVKSYGRGPSAGAQILLGMAERGGRVSVKHVRSTGIRVVHAAMKEAIAPGSHIHTDGAVQYKRTAQRGFKHTAYHHYHPGEWEPGRLLFKPVDGPSTQQIENFWGELKRGIHGVYRHASPKYFELYGAEYAFRYSNRKSDVPMFDLLLERIYAH